VLCLVGAKTLIFIGYDRAFTSNRSVRSRPLQDMEGRIAEVIREELARQAEASENALIVANLDGRLRVSGEVDLESLAMAVVGAVAGGP
jgi:hypothetical protein